jgi:HEAT repeat protein
LLADPVLGFADETVAETASHVLGRIADPCAVPVRTALARFQLVNGAEALAALGDESSMSLMIDGLDDDFHRGRLEDAIRSFGNRALPALDAASRGAEEEEEGDLSGPRARRRASIRTLTSELHRPAGQSSS